MGKPSPARNIASSLDFGPLSQGLAAFDGSPMAGTTATLPPNICINTLVGLKPLKFPDFSPVKK